MVFEVSMTVYGRRWWHPTPVLLPGKPHGRRSLVGCSPWGREEPDTTEQLHFHFSLSCIGGGNGNPLQGSCLENPRDGGAWLAAVYGVTQSQTRLNRLRSSSSSSPYNSDCVMICSYYLLLRDFWDPLKLRLYMPVDFNVVFNNHYLNWTRNNKLVPNRTRSTSRLYIVTLLI